jgi:hypothetical protein
VVSTSKGAEGLDVEVGKHLLIGDTPSEFAMQVVRVLREPGLRKSLSAQAAQLVKDRYEAYQPPHRGAVRGRPEDLKKRYLVSLELLSTVLTRKNIADADRRHI